MAGSHRWPSAAWEEPLENLFSAEPVMGRYVGHDPGERPDTQSGVVRYRQVVLRFRARREPNVAAGLANDLVP